MTSLINITNIDITYPIAGQDNDTQGFRTNFQNIRNNFVTARSEITALQSNVETILTTIDTVVTANTVPETSSSIGTKGQLAVDTDYLYVCVGTNLWKRITLDTF